jgi:hypothetical protein
MKQSISKVAIGLLVGVVGSSAFGLENSWTPLFDGHSLGGWTATTGANWRVENAAITVDSGKPGFLLAEGEFLDFELSLEFLAARGTNSGVFLRTTPCPTNVSKECYELNIAPPANPYPTGSLVQRVRVDEPESPARWRRFDVVVNDRNIRVKIDGRAIVDYDAEHATAGRRIALQYRAGPVAFRNIRVRNFTEK